MIFRIETNMKMNIVDLKSKERYIKDGWKLKKNEVHYMRMEGHIGLIDKST